jgi:plastocyanin
VPSSTPLAAVPGSYIANYATPVGVVSVAGDLTFVNGDVAFHDVISDAAGPEDQSWCELYEGKPCPLLWSPLIPLGRTTDVLGTENLESGATYGFYCSIHPHMRGTLVVS